jgi:autotransporter translocation and assembly factor TamB
LASIAHRVVPSEVRQKLVGQTDVTTGEASSYSINMDFRVSTSDA